MVDLPHIKRSEKIISKQKKMSSSQSTPPPPSTTTTTTTGSKPKAVVASGGAASASGEGKKTKRKIVRLQSGKWFEEMLPGTVISHVLTRTVTETDNVLFTTMSMNPAPIHLDHELSKDTEFGKPLFNR